MEKINNYVAIRRIAILLCIVFLFLATPVLADERIQKMSITYNGRIHYSDIQQYIAQHFDLVDTEISALAANRVQWIKNNAVNPNFKAIGYYDAILQSTWMDDWAYFNSVQEEDWFVHHYTNGERITRHPSVDPNAYVMKVDPDGGWANYYIDRAVNGLNDYPVYDGIFVDDLWYKPSYDNTFWSYYPSQWERIGGVSIGDESIWGPWTEEYMGDLKSAVGTKIVMPNTVPLNVLDDIADQTHAVFLEHFVHKLQTPVTDNGRSPSNIIDSIEALRIPAANGDIIAVVGGSDPGTGAEDWAKFTYACFSFAVEDPEKAYFAWNFMPSNPSSNPPWYPFMDMEIGMPEDDYHQIADPGDYIYERTFENYYIIANLDSLTSPPVSFNFNGNSYTLAGKHALFIPRTPGTGNAYYVSTIGNDANPGTLSQPWRTIQKAANTVVAGDTVYIRGGTYNEKVTLQNKHGTSSEWITFMPYNNENVIVDASGISGTYDGIFRLLGANSYIRITGLTLKSTRGHGIFLNANGGEINHIRIDHCTIHDCESSGIYCWSDSANSHYVRNVEFDHNIVYDVNNGISYGSEGCSPQEAISFSNVQGFEIHHNTLSLYGKEGIDAKSGSSDGSIHHNVIDTSNNDLATTCVWHQGIYIDGYTRVNSNIDVYNNIITGSGGNGIILNAEKPGDGGAIQNINVYNNIVSIHHEPGWPQFRCLDSLDNADWTNVKIYDNTFFNNGGNPSRIIPDAAHITNLIIANNIFSTTGTNCLSFQSLSHPQPQVTLTNNLFYRSDGSGHATWTNGIYDGINPINSDPKFVGGGDFHLQSDSPAKDTGISTYSSTFDFDGNPRPIGGGYDIGAYEYQIGGGNNPPVFSNLDPFNGENNVPITKSSLTLTITDPDGDSFAWEITTSPDVGSCSNSGNSGIKSCSISGLQYSTTYQWTVRAFDGTDTTQETFSFETSALSFTNCCGTIGNWYCGWYPFIGKYGCCFGPSCQDCCDGGWTGDSCDLFEWCSQGVTAREGEEYDCWKTGTFPLETLHTQNFGCTEACCSYICTNNRGMDGGACDPNPLPADACECNSPSGGDCKCYKTHGGVCFITGETCCYGTLIDTTDDVYNCGQCGKDCTANHDGKVNCKNGKCCAPTGQICYKDSDCCDDKCNEGRCGCPTCKADCNPIPSPNDCETDICTDPNNCGGCNQVCSSAAPGNHIDTANPECINGWCTCQADWMRYGACKPSQQYSFSPPECVDNSIWNTCNSQDTVFQGFRLWGYYSGSGRTRASDLCIGGVNYVAKREVYFDVNEGKNVSKYVIYSCDPDSSFRTNFRLLQGGAYLVYPDVGGLPIGRSPADKFKVQFTEGINFLGWPGSNLDITVQKAINRNLTEGRSYWICAQ